MPASAFDDVEDTLRRDYEAQDGAEALPWAGGASAACRAAWHRADQLQGGERD